MGKRRSLERKKRQAQEKLEKKQNRTISANPRIPFNIDKDMRSLMVENHKLKNENMTLKNKTKTLDDRIKNNSHIKYYNYDKTFLVEQLSHTKSLLDKKNIIQVSDSIRNKTCIVCGESGGEHHIYYEPEIVVYLCQKHHFVFGNYIIYQLINYRDKEDKFKERFKMSISEAETLRKSWDVLVQKQQPLDGFEPEIFNQYF